MSRYHAASHPRSPKRAWIGRGFGDAARNTCRVTTNESNTITRAITYGTTTERTRTSFVHRVTLERVGTRAQPLAGRTAGNSCKPGCSKRRSSGETRIWRERAVANVVDRVVHAIGCVM